MRPRRVSRYTSTPMGGMQATGSVSGPRDCRLVHFINSSHSSNLKISGNPWAGRARDFTTFRASAEVTVSPLSGEPSKAPRLLLFPHRFIGVISKIHLVYPVADPSGARIADITHSQAQYTAMARNGDATVQ